MVGWCKMICLALLSGGVLAGFSSQAAAATSSTLDVISVDRAILMTSWESVVNTVAAGLSGIEVRQTPDASGPEHSSHLWEWRG